MERRSYLVAAGAVTLAGCLGSSDSGTPSYSQSNQQNMILTENDFPPEWERNDQLSQDYDAAFQKPADGTLLMTGLDIYGSVSEAEENFNDVRSGFQDTTPLDFADEAFGGTQGGTAIVAFRHGNAAGQTVGFQQSGANAQPTYETSETYARKMYDKWQQI